MEKTFDAHLLHKMALQYKRFNWLQNPLTSLLSHSLLLLSVPKLGFSSVQNPSLPARESLMLHFLCSWCGVCLTMFNTKLPRASTHSLALKIIIFVNTNSVVSVVSSLLLLGQATVQQAYKKTAYSYNQ
jgi:hypothetical protein